MSREELASRLVMRPIDALPGAPTANAAAAPERFSGYFKLGHTKDAHMFFFLFEARNNPDTAPLVLWMTGGPGCSSELAVFFENGPWTINEDLSLNETQYGWDTNAHMIFVDQPIQTGFSYTSDNEDHCYDEICVSNDMLDFMQALLQNRPHLADKDFFVTGESYAGHYVPAVAHRIWNASRTGEVEQPIKLMGLAIGNGLTDPAIQYGAYADFMARNGKISQATADRIMILYPACRVALEICTGLAWAPECLLAVNFCQAVIVAPIMLLNPGFNVYDIRKRCEGPLCYKEFERLDKYINQPEVRKALGVGDRTWEACNMEVHEDMMGDWGISYQAMIPPLLHDGVRVLVYAGDQDFICNWLGNRRWVDAMQWDGAAAWAAAQDEVWEVDGEEAGLVKSMGPLTFLRVAAAGHMVPMDQPKHALEMITRFTRNKPLATSLAAPRLTRVGGGGGRKVAPAL